MNPDTAIPGTRGKRGTARPPDRKPYKRTSIQETIDVLMLHSRGVSMSEIARTVGISVQRVSDRIRAYRSTTDTALGVLQAHAHQAAVDWVKSFGPARKRGEHRPMRDALIATGVIAPDPENQGITVIVGSGDVSIAGVSQSLKLPAPLDVVDSHENPANTLTITSTNTLPTPDKPL